METGQRIKALRLQKGFTQEELAERTEVSTRTIQRIENGEVDPRAYTLQMIAKALDVNYGELVAEVEEADELKALDDNNFLGLLHLSGLLPLFFPSLIVWHYRKYTTKEMAIHLRASISLQLCILGIALVGLWIFWQGQQITPLVIGLLVGAFTSILNAVNVMHGKAFINPFLKEVEKLSGRLGRKGVENS